MSKKDVNGGSLQCRVCRLLHLLFLAFFTISPISDAYVDSLNFSSHVLNDIHDSDSNDIIAIENINDNRNAIHESKASKYAFKAYQAFIQRASMKDESACQIKKIKTSANDINPSQICPSVSSDLSPPVV